MIAIDLRPNDLELVREILRAHAPQGAKVYVFGSRATGSAKVTSDLDLAIDAGQPVSLTTLEHLNEGFQDSDLNFKVDVVDLNSLSDSFRSIIVHTMVELEYLI